MHRVPAVPRRFSHTILAFWLCLLAFSFAIEAKLAWYGPAVGPGSDVRAAKAIPENTPKLVLHGVPTPDPIHPALGFIVLGVFAATCAFGAEVLLWRESLYSRPMFCIASCSSPSQFRRPPPAC